jgi:hypothetical protein
MLAIMLFVSSCSSNDEPIVPEPPETPVDYSITLSKSALHFTSKANRPDTIEVTTAGNWGVAEDLDWISVTIEDNKLIVTAEPSRKLDNREGTITVSSDEDPAQTATIQVAQDHGTPTLYRDYFTDRIPIEHLSPNGRYVAGEFAEVGIVVDLYQIGNAEYQPTFYGMEDESLRSDGSFMLRGVDNSGKPFAKGVTADGSTTVRFQKTDGLYRPYLVKNGTSTELPFPSTYLTEEVYQGVYVDLISADGKYILGRINADGSTWVACKWTLNGAEYEFSVVAEDQTVYDPDAFKFEQWAEPNDVTGLSVMGTHSCGAVRIPGNFFLGTPNQYIPYWYNMSTNTYELVSTETNARASYITDDGLLFCATPYDFPFGGDRTPFVYSYPDGGTTQTFSEWVRATYGLEVPNQGIVTAVAADYSVLAWFTNEGGFVNHVIIVEP